MIGELIHNIDDFLYPILELGLLFYLAFGLFGFRPDGKHRTWPRLTAALGSALFYRVLLLMIDRLNLLGGKQLSDVRQANDILTLGEAPIMQVIMILYSFLVIFIFTKQGRILEFLLVTLFLPLSDMIRIISYSLSRLLPETVNEDLVFAARMLLTLGFLFALAWLFRKYFAMLCGNPRRIYLACTALAAFFSNLLGILIKQKLSEISLVTILFSLILILILVFFLQVEKIIQNYNNRLRLQYHEEMEENDRQTIMEMEKATEEIRKWRHEYQNQMLLLKSYCEESRFGELEAAIDGFLVDMPHLEKRIRTNNQELDMIINRKMSESKDAGIQMQVEISFPENLPLERRDLFSLLNNLLNNAIEAAGKTENPRVYLNIRPVQGYLLIQVRNTCLGDVLKDNPHLETRKENRFFHGMGVTVIRSIVEKYDGILNFSQENDIFQGKVLLPMAEDPVSS